MGMEMEQELEWSKAQKIVISEDLVAAAKRQLQFLAAVDRNRWLYDGPALQRAIYRYNACWLPLLAKNSESLISEGPLVVPLDCEWIWHCHRLNPVRYKSDCEKFYGRILDNHNVVSSVQGTSKRETEEIWNKLYPDESYDFDLTRAFSTDISEELPGDEKYTKYNLVSAVERQSPFFYQVSRPHMENDLFLEGSVARYKGFLHLIKINREQSIRRFCVPTYDIDLIWHSHQLHPVSYCKDLIELVGKVLEHDDTDSDRTKGMKLDTGFSETTKQWEETFGSRYWRAGAMYRGSAPAPLTTTPCTSNIKTKNVIAPEGHQKIIHLPEVNEVEVLLEFVEIRNLPEGHKGGVSVIFSKTQPDIVFNAKRKLSILSMSGKKQVACFHCQPSGHLLFELVSHSFSNLPISRPAKIMGSTSISLEQFLAPVCNLSVDKWLELTPISDTVNSKPICLRVAVSFTIPIPAQHVLHVAHSRPFLKSSCFFPLPGKIQSAKSWTRVTDEAGIEIVSLQMRGFKKAKGRNVKVLTKEVVGITKSGETRMLAESVGTKWSLIDSQWSLQPKKNVNKDDHLFELTGQRMVKLFPGRKLDYEPKHCEKQRSDRDFMTAVDFSAEDPYGKAVALLDLKCGIFKVQEEWLVLPGIIMAFIFCEILRKEGFKGLTFSDQKLEGDLLMQEAHEEDQKTNFTTSVEKGVQLNAEVTKGSIVVPETARIHGGGCGGCGSGCGNETRSGGCGGCGAGCGNKLESGGCGSCGSMVVNSGGSSGCGGCGAGCVNKVKSAGCGGCGAGCGGCGSGCGGCGNMVVTGGCGGCGGGCGSKLVHGNSTGILDIGEHPKQTAMQANDALGA